MHLGSQVMLLWRFWFPFLISAHICAQTTQGIIGGRVVDEVTLRAVDGAEVLLTAQTGQTGVFRSVTDKNGSFSFVSLDPGTYNLRVSANKYRAAEVRGLDLPVSGMVVRTFQLRLLSDLWQAGLSRSVFAGDRSSVVPVYGPDVDLSRSAYIERAPSTTVELAPSLSKEITRDEIFYLPLAGRDPYAMVVLQPNVANDISTVRGLGVSANGQRPSSTEFLLDGFQNNNYLSTGVLSVLPPEAIQEYRLSINNFSAEFGGTSGYLANVVTRSSTNDWNFQLYADFTNQSWNAVDFQTKLNGGPAPAQAISTGAVFGGALIRDKVFTTTSFVADSSSASEQPTLFTLPTQPLLIQLQQSGGAAGELYSRFAAPVAPGTGGFGEVSLRPSVRINHVNGLERVDFAPANGKVHSFARVVEDRVSQPDFIWSPYPDFRSGLDQSVSGLGWSTNITTSPNQNLEIRAGFTSDSFGWNRGHPEIPILTTESGMNGVSDAVIGSPASYTFQNNGKTAEISTNSSLTRGLHAMKWGVSYFERWMNSNISALPAVSYLYDSAQDLIAGQPGSVNFPASLSALANGTVAVPDNSRRYRYWQMSGYIQDSYRLTDRLLIHFGVRYEYFSPPKNIGSIEDSLLNFGPGSSMPARITNIEAAGGRQVYDHDFRNLAPRVGFAYKLDQSGTFVLRGSYGIFYDRPFDNLWLNVSLNDNVPAYAVLTNSPLNPLNGITSNLKQLFPEGLSQPTSCQSPTAGILILDCSHDDQTLFQPGLRTPYVQSLFAGTQKQIGRSISAEIDYAGALGRRLLTTDIINRQLSDLTRYNEQLADLNYRANQGYSSHHALVASVSMRSSPLILGLNYTWSHTMDNQSEPLAGFALNLARANIFSEAISPRQAAFTVQFDSNSDRGNSDFDQRQVFSSYFTWFLPKPSGIQVLEPLLRNWVIGGISSVRSGSPFSVYAAYDSLPFFNNRADLIEPNRTSANQPYTGGKIILNSTAFAQPADGVLGSAGRNAFYGPGTYNLDLSLGRTFTVRNKERLRFTFRADAFNLLNHANLNNPIGDSCCGDSSPPFGLALYGRNENSIGLPLSVPLSETARQLHFVVRVTF